jgi:hypothetical protein
MNAAAMALIIFSCSITLNPDGSGKAVIEVRQMGGGGLGKGGPSLEDKARAANPENQLATARIAIMGCQGVEAWSDLSLSATPDAQVTFKGTAYFKNLDRFQIGVPGADQLSMTWNKGAKAGGVLKFDPLAIGPQPKPAKLPPDELAKRVTKARADWQEERLYGLSRRIEPVVSDISFKLPGEPADVVGFKKEADGTVHIKIDGKKYWAAVDALVADDKALGDAIQLAGGEGFDSGVIWQVLQEMKYGAKLPMTATVKGEMKPPFDYAAEVKAAGQPAPAVAAQAEALVKQLGAAGAGQRDEAEKKLVDLARTQDIRVILQKHADDADPEVVARVRRVLANPEATWGMPTPESLAGRLKALADRAAAMERERRDREKAREAPGAGAHQPPPGETLEQQRMRMAAEQAAERQRAAEKAAAEK